MCLHTVRLESAEQPLWFDRHTPWTPAGHTLKQQDSEELAKRKSALCCVQCQHVITEHAARLELAGGHLQNALFHIEFSFCLYARSCYGA